MKAFPLYMTSILILFAALPAAAKEIRCQVDNVTREDSALPVPVTSPHEPSQAVTYEGVQASAQWAEGDRFESQSFLRMGLDDTSSVIYDVDMEQTSPLNILSKGDVRFQCWAE